MDINVGIVGLIVLALNVYAIVRIISSSATAGSKTLWIVGILILPVVGLIAWALLGPKGPAKSL